MEVVLTVVGNQDNGGNGDKADSILKNLKHSKEFKPRYKKDIESKMKTLNQNENYPDNVYKSF
jgi:hypothetical protein